MKRFQRNENSFVARRGRIRRSIDHSDRSVALERRKTKASGRRSHAGAGFISTDRTKKNDFFTLAGCAKRLRRSSVERDDEPESRSLRGGRGFDRELF